MNGEKPILNEDAGITFDLKDMNEEERKAMFMRVSVKSLSMWMSYYEGKQQFEVCREIKEIRDFKNGSRD
ncbi:MAG TPA: hypothetical protein VEB42_11395 [Chitinophagaceae bacterium]|nr:hypothetical protein [Chitinophagaceae bacterium]